MNNLRTAWYDEEKLPFDMARHASGQVSGWAKLEETDHFPYMKKLIDFTKCESLAELGCGAGDIGRVFQGKFRYVGYDLPHIVEKVSKQVNPNLNFEYFDANIDDFYFLSNYDLVLCNAFISELDNPFEVLKKILENSKKFIIIHRQHFDKDTRMEKYKTYGLLETVKSVLSTSEFENIVVKNNYQIKINNDFNWGKTILLEKS